MGSQVPMFAGPADYRAFKEYAYSIGLRILPLLVSQLDEKGEYPFADAPEKGWATHLSPRPVEELHPYGDPPVNISWATDPLIEFERPYYDPPYLVGGRIWVDPPARFRDEVMPYYTELTRWVRKNWSKGDQGPYYIGPDARRLVREEGAVFSTFPPGTPKRIVLI